MSETAANTYTLDEVVHTLHETLNDPGRERLVIEGLKVLKDRRLAEAQTQERQQLIVDVAELYHRTSGSTSNIEGIHEDLEEASLTFLHDIAESEKPSSLEKLTAEAAATVFVYGASLKDTFDDTNKKILEDSPVDIDKLIDRFRQGIKQAWGVEDGSPEANAMNSTLNTLDSLAEHLYMQLGPDEWKLIVDPPMQKLRQALLDEGVQLRQLNDNGKYDDEEA